ncbi:MAG TPA: hypothetical protein VHS96_08020 [Bacteroidia bacterium]|nr:hypothetical protein [Bacteroidia bacterium]
MKTKGFWVLKGLKFALMGAAFVTLAGFVVMGLWNWLMPTIFGLGAITWLQAMGLLILAKIFFGGRGGWGGRSGGCHGGHGRHEHWRKKFEQRWENMSDEEKAKMKAKWGNRCGGFPGDKPETEEKAAS